MYFSLHRSLNVTRRRQRRRHWPASSESWLQGTLDDDDSDNDTTTQNTKHLPTDNPHPPPKKTLIIFILSVCDKYFVKAQRVPTWVPTTALKVLTMPLGQLSAQSHVRQPSASLASAFPTQSRRLAQSTGGHATVPLNSEPAQWDKPTFQRLFCIITVL